MKKRFLISLIISVLAFNSQSINQITQIKTNFERPGNEYKPWVYWFVMDGFLNKEGITKDLEAMSKVGIGGVILLEVNLGGEQGKNEFMSKEWRECFQHILNETERLKMELTLGSGPGWTGSGGPWIHAENSMLQLISSKVNVKGDVDMVLPKPVAEAPYFGWESLNDQMKKERAAYFKDVSVLAFPKIDSIQRISDINEKALYTRNGNKEEMAVTPAQHPSSLVGKSWRRETGQPPLNEFDMVDSAYVPWLGKTVKNPEGYGIYFQDRWNESLKTDPEMLYINDWNEWTAGKYPPLDSISFPFMRRKSQYFFVDQYNAEFNRCVQPMKDGYTDNYYMQMAQNIRKYKGIRPIPVQHGFHSIKIDGQFTDWEKVVNEFRDTKGDTFHRDHKGYGGFNYNNEFGRNDIITRK